MYKEVQVKLDDPRLMPTRGHATDAGADLRSPYGYAITPGSKVMVDTGVAVKIPVGNVGLVFNRSSQGKIEVQLANAVGVIDSDYRGNIKVLLKNNGDQMYVITPYETRVAQLVIVPYIPATFIPFDQAWDDTKRGTGGFGSTGQ